MNKTKEKTISLTPKEAYLLWSIAIWFGSSTPRITFALMEKLFAVMTEKERSRFRKMFGDNWVLRQMVKDADWVKVRHPEFLEEQK